MLLTRNDICTPLCVISERSREARHEAASKLAPEHDVLTA